MSRFTFDEYMAAVDSGRLGIANIITELLEQEENNAILNDALHAAYARNFVLEGIEDALKTEPAEIWGPVGMLARAITLIKWLALPWGENDPYWPTTDAWTGQQLAANVQLRSSWNEFVRSTGQPEEQESSDKLSEPTT